MASYTISWEYTDSDNCFVTGAMLTEMEAQRVGVELARAEKAGAIKDPSVTPTPDQDYESVMDEINTALEESCSVTSFPNTEGLDEPYRCSNCGRCYEKLDLQAPEEGNPDCPGCGAVCFRVDEEGEISES